MLKKLGVDRTNGDAPKIIDRHSFAKDVTFRYGDSITDAGRVMDNAADSMILNKFVRMVAMAG